MHVRRANVVATLVIVQLRIVFAAALSIKIAAAVLLFRILSKMHVAQDLILTVSLHVAIFFRTLQQVVDRPHFILSYPNRLDYLNRPSTN